MGILRADRVSGLGGANAFNGSVFFNGQPSSFLRTEVDSSDFVLGTSDFTIECWIYQDWLDDSGLIHFGPGGYGYYNSIFHLASTNQVQLYLSSNGSSWDIANGTQIGTRTAKTWHHLALCRSGSSFYGFVDGTLGATITGQSGAIRQGASEVDQNQLCIGHRISTFNGYISNFRYIKGTALYTAAFTPPVGRLEKTSDTIILCCQSPGNVMQEATGRNLIVEAGGASNAVTASSGVGPPVASHFAPDVGEDHGTTFADNTKFDNLSYLVPSGGTTAESNRGRAVMGGGTDGSSDYMKTIDYFSIPSEGNSIDFGDLSYATRSLGACSSSTRGLFAGGMGPASEVATNSISYITIATTANGSDFGDLSVAKRQMEGLSNQTRGIWPGGQNDTPASNTEINSIDYVTIATTGNAADFGDIQEAKESTSTCASSTRGLIAGGDDGPAYKNTIGYITIATTGNATNFGDLSLARSSGTGCSNETRGLFFGGRAAPNNYNTIEYVTIASTGDSTDFGDLTATLNQTQSAASQIRGVLAGGNPNSSPNITNLMEYVNIASTGNSSDFGDTTAIKTRGGTSDCHGGL